MIDAAPADPCMNTPAAAPDRATAQGIAVIARRQPARARIAALAAVIGLASFPAGPLRAQLAPPSPAPIAAPTAAPTAAPPRLPALGEPISGELSVGAERRFGELIMRDVRRDPSVIDDPLPHDYIRQLWEPLVDAARQRGEITPETDGVFAWETFLVRDRSVNAFALPGGYVGVHLGLIAMTSTRDELAAVLAHELSHVTQRHIARGMSSAQKQSLLGMAAMILGVIAASRAGNADMANAAIMGSQAAMIQGQLNFSRDMEREADRVGFSIFTDAGFAPAGVASMFEKLDYANRLNDNGAYPYLRSHPLTIERIGEARTRVEAALAREAPVSTPHRGDAHGPGHSHGTPAAVVVTGLRNQPQAWLHALMQGRARVLMDSSDSALRRWVSGAAPAAAVAPNGAQPLERATALYGATLSAAMLRNASAAENALAALRRLVEAHTNAAAHADVQQALRHLEADLRLATGDPAGAHALLSARKPGGASGANPRRADLLNESSMALAWARAAAKAPSTSSNLAVQNTALEALNLQAERLQTWVTVQPADGSAWALLSQAQELLGRPLRAVRADAESRIAAGDLNGALDRLRAGQRMARSTTTPDHIEASVIDARARAVEKMRRTRFAELRGIREEDLPPVLPPNVPL